MHNSYSLHKIEEANSFSFSPADYSKFKYGDDQVAEDFGTSLAEGFIEDVLSDQPIENQIVVISSPYAFIPTATFAMKNHFVYTLNKWLVEQAYPVVQETQIHRTVTYKEDYGSLSAEERINLISNDHFHIDSTFLQDKTLIFLDDIRITGGHEKMIKKMIKDHSLSNESYLLYFAELVNPAIHPRIENYLNYYFVKSIFDLDPIVSNDRFVVNTRIVKYILNSKPADFVAFAEEQSYHFLNLLYNMALGNSYHLMDAYSTNLDHLKRMLSPVEYVLGNGRGDNNTL